MRGAAVPPQRTADGTHARPAGALLLPQFLARSGHFMPGLGLGGSAPHARQMMPYGFIQQRFVDRRREYHIRQVHGADFFVTEIDDIYAWHGYVSPSGTLLFRPPDDHVSA